MPIDARRDVYQAIADPTRRQIIDLVAKESMTLNAIAENFDISRPAVSQQVKILAECGLILITQQGRERYCEVQLSALRDVVQWVEQYRAFWEARMDKLGSVMTGWQSKKKKHQAIKRKK